MVRWSGGIAPRINLWHKIEVSGQLHAPAALLQGEVQPLPIRG
jgi:hypothetical protein